MSEMVKIDPVTGRTYRRGFRRDTVTYKGVSKVIEQPGWWPDDGNDNDGILVGSDNDVWDDALREIKRSLGEDADEPRLRTPAAE